MMYMSNLRLISFDDYIRVRAPQGVAWYTADLQFSTRGELTQANDLGAKNPTVEFETPNVSTSEPFGALVSAIKHCTWCLHLMFRTPVSSN